MKGTYGVGDDDEQDLKPAWWEDGSDSTILIQHFLKTSIELGAPMGLVGGADVTGKLRVAPIPRAYETVMGMIDRVGRLAVTIKIGLPPFVRITGPPVGCEEWDANEQTCVLTYLWNSPPTVREISFGMSMPPSMPTPSAGVVTTSATGVKFWVPSPYGPYLQSSAPVGSVIPSSAGFAVFEPPLVTSVSLSSPVGWPQGEAVIATFGILHRQASPFDFTVATGTFQLRWPEFLTAPPLDTAVCDSFVLDADGHGALCQITGFGPPGSSVRISLEFPMPPDAPKAEAAWGNSPSAASR